MNLGGDLLRLGGDGERPLPGDVGLLLGGVSPRRYGDSTRRRTGESPRRRIGESARRLGDPPLRATGDLLRGETAGFRGGEANIITESTIRKHSQNNVSCTAQ